MIAFNMKLVEQTFMTILIIIIIGILLSGWFYKNPVTYKSIGFRTNYSASNKELKNLIDERINKK